LWSQSANWQGGVVPGALDTAIFSQENLTGRRVASCTVNENRTVGAIQIDSWSSTIPFTLQVANGNLTVTSELASFLKDYGTITVSAGHLLDFEGGQTLTVSGGKITGVGTVQASQGYTFLSTVGHSTIDITSVSIGAGTASPGHWNFSGLGSNSVTLGAGTTVTINGLNSDINFSQTSGTVGGSFTDTNNGLIINHGNLNILSNTLDTITPRVITDTNVVVKGDWIAKKLSITGGTVTFYTSGLIFQTTTSDPYGIEETGGKIQFANTGSFNFQTSILVSGTSSTNCAYFNTWQADSGFVTVTITGNFTMSGFSEWDAKLSADTNSKDYISVEGTATIGASTGDVKIVAKFTKPKNQIALHQTWQLLNGIGGYVNGSSLNVYPVDSNNVNVSDVVFTSVAPNTEIRLWTN
jgi:hypothetical protein